MENYRYRFIVLGRFRAQLLGNEPHVTLNVLAGPDDHFTYCGTLTMSEPQWDAFSAGLASVFGPNFEVEDRSTEH